MALNSADSEARTFRDGSAGLRFFLTAALSVALMFLDHRGNYLREIRGYLGAGMYPLQVAVNAPFAGSQWLQENLAQRRTLLAENDRLRGEALVNSAQLQRLASLDAENTRLRALLDSTPRVPARVVVAEILSLDMDPLRHRVVLNRGSKEGVSEGQALIDASGVVGQITRDQIFTSEAILITDPDHAVPVEILRNGLRTIAVGTGDMKQLSLPFLTRNADVKAGDLLVTSGLGGTFPASYPVGTVTRVDSSSGDAFLDIAASPAAQLDRLHEVLVVSAIPPPERATVPAPEPAAPPAKISPASPRPAPAAAPAPVVATPSAPATAAVPEPAPPPPVTGADE